MKSLVKFNSNWFERLCYKISDFDKKIIEDQKDEEKISKIWEYFRKNSSKIADNQDAKIAQEICDKFLKLDHELICCNVMLPSCHGFIIYKKDFRTEFTRF